ncbi:MAG: hypothetical protein KAJ07_00445 [Planctomycetes bacterium]|nr:hypothetical protein [Planctomycetota bacterium]
MHGGRVIGIPVSMAAESNCPLPTQYVAIPADPTSLAVEILVQEFTAFVEIFNSMLAKLRKAKYLELEV